MISPKNWLGLIFLLLIIGIINVIRIPSDNDAQLKRAALEWSLATLTATLILWGAFDSRASFNYKSNRVDSFSGLKFPMGPYSFSCRRDILVFFYFNGIADPHLHFNKLKFHKVFIERVFVVLTIFWRFC